MPRKARKLPPLIASDSFVCLEARGSSVAVSVSLGLLEMIVASFSASFDTVIGVHRRDPLDHRKDQRVSFTVVDAQILLDFLAGLALGLDLAADGAHRVEGGQRSRGAGGRGGRGSLGCAGAPVRASARRRLRVCWSAGAAQTRTVARCAAAAAPVRPGRSVMPVCWQAPRLCSLARAAKIQRARRGHNGGRGRPSCCPQRVGKRRGCPRRVRPTPAPRLQWRQGLPIARAASASCRCAHRRLVAFPPARGPGTRA